MELIENNYDSLKVAIQQLPAYNVPDINWDIVEHSLDTDVRNLPNNKIPKDIWAEIEASLDAQKITLPELQIPVDIWDKIVNELGTSENNIIDINERKRVDDKGKKSFGRVWKVMAFAASVVLLFGVGKYLVLQNDAPQMMAFDGSALKSMQFEDGSVVYSKQNAKINYPKKFAKNTREVIQTDGVAFYEITKNSERPFIIHSEIATVTVLGTSFTTTVNDDSLQVIVKTGKVSVASDDEVATLLPTESVVYYADGRKPRLIDAGAQEVLSSNTANNTDNQKIISYNATSLISILEDVKLKYNVQITYNTKVLKDKKITGRFVDGDANALITAICEASGLTVVKNNQTYIIQ